MLLWRQPSFDIESAVTWLWCNRWAMAEGYGACLLGKPELLSDMVRQARDRVSDPDFTISIKIRIHNDIRLVCPSYGFSPMGLRVTDFILLLTDKGFNTNACQTTWEKAKEGWRDGVGEEGGGMWYQIKSVNVIVKRFGFQITWSRSMRVQRGVNVFLRSYVIYLKIGSIFKMMCIIYDVYYIYLSMLSEKA